LSGGCAETPTAPPTDFDIALVDFALPWIDTSLLVEMDTSTVSQLGGPERTAYAEGDHPELYPYDASDAVSPIYEASTIAWFTRDAAYARGENYYRGNKGRIETTLNVMHQGQTLASHTAVREKNWIFWLDFGLMKHIDATARIPIDRSCGLTAWGTSTHLAWWEAAPGGSLGTFGRSVVSTTSDLARQPECPPVVPESGGGGGGSYDEEGYLTCYYWVVYDLRTGKIYDIEFLFCESEGG
jgi:hypothetical protein